MTFPNTIDDQKRYTPNPRPHGHFDEVLLVQNYTCSANISRGDASLLLKPRCACQAQHPLPEYVVGIITGFRVITSSLVLPDCRDTYYTLGHIRFACGAQTSTFEGMGLALPETEEES